MLRNTYHLIGKTLLLSLITGAASLAHADLAVYYDVQVTKLGYSGESDDACSGPDPRWRVWVSDDTTSSTYGKTTWQIDNVSVPYTWDISDTRMREVSDSAANVIQLYLNAWEEDDSSGDDGETGDKNIANIGFRDESSSTYNTFQNYGPYSASADGYNYQVYVKIKWYYSSPCAAPDAVTAQELGDGTIRVSWNSIEDADLYEVYRGTVDNSALATRIAVDIPDAYYVDASAAADTTYYYWVKAYRSSNNVSQVKTDTLSAFSGSDSGSGSDTLQDFRVIALPDTQNYSDDHPDIYVNQTQWIVNNITAMNIGFVTHLGDYVNNHDDVRQWTNAENAMDILDASGIPWGSIPGNHDFLYGDGANDYTATNYRERFGAAHFADKPWYGGASPSDLSNYQIVNFGTENTPFKILFLHLNLETPAIELAWAQTVINAHRDLPVMISTHRYMQDAEDTTGIDNLPVVDSGRYPDIWYTFETLYLPTGIQADTFFNSFVKTNRNIFAVLCGHYHGEYNQVSMNNYSLPVYEMLSDFQDDDNGGDGWLRILNFRPNDNQVFIQTYSTYRQEYRTDSDSQFTIAVNFAEYTQSEGEMSITFREGVDGYVGTLDTYVNEDSKGSSYGNSSIINIDNDVTNSPFGDTPTRGLLRFTNIFQDPVYEGDETPTAIPSDAEIGSATLTINIVDDVDIGDEDLDIHLMLINWNENSSWNNLGDINSSGKIGPLLARVSGDNDPDGSTGRNIQVTDAVTAWINGEPNYGFALLPENIDWNDDGMEIASSEYSESLMRPALTVDFSYTVHNRAPSVTQTLTASELSVNEGDSITLSLSAADANSADPLLLYLNGVATSFSVGTLAFSEPWTFEDDGQYAFTAVVNDDEDSVSGGSVTVSVANLPPVIGELTAAMAVKAGETFALSGTATDPGVLDILTYSWDLDNDGDFSDATGPDISHSFAAAGVYTVTLKVADDDGAEVTQSTTITVQGTYDAWAVINNHVGGVNEDADGDGTNNGTEYLLDFDPNDPAQTLLLNISRGDITSGGVRLSLTYVKPNGTYRIYASENPTGATDGAELVATITPSVEGDNVPVTDMIEGALPSNRFYFITFEAAQ